MDFCVDRRVELLSELLKLLQKNSGGISEQQLRDFVGEGKALNFYFDPKVDVQISERARIHQLWWVVKNLINPEEISITVSRIPFRHHIHPPKPKFQLRCWKGKEYGYMTEGHVDISTGCADMLFEAYLTRELNTSDLHLPAQLKDIGIDLDGWITKRETVESRGHQYDILTFQR